MKRNDFAEIKTMDEKALAGKAKELKLKIADQVMDKNMNKVKDLKSSGKLRKDLAQVLTVLRQKELIREFESVSEGGSE